MADLAIGLSASMKGNCNPVPFRAQPAGSPLDSGVDSANSQPPVNGWPFLYVPGTNDDCGPPTVEDVKTAASDTMERVRSAAAGDADAFRGLVREVYPLLRRWALARTGNPDDADEVVQRSLIRWHQSLGDFSGEARLTTWLYRIVANTAIDLQRSQAAGSGERRQSGESGDEKSAVSPDPVREIHAARMAAAVRDFFETLPPRQREVLELVDNEGLRPVDVAEMLGIEPVSMRANLFKARRAVRSAMLSRYPELTEGYET